MNFSKVLKSNNRVTLKEAGMKYVMFLGDRQHLLFDTETKTLEVWASNKNHASFGLTYKNTDLEFCSSFSNRGLKIFTTEEDLKNYYMGIV